MKQDTLWQLMVASVRLPDKFGLKVDGVSVRDMDGYMQRTLRVLEMPGTPAVTDNIRVNERKREITFRLVVDMEESQDERVLALRESQGLRWLEIFCRRSKDEETLQPV